jgi:hypothetical protein
VPPHSRGGRGLWIVRQLCDALHIITTTSGTTITAMIAAATTAGGGSATF